MADANTTTTAQATTTQDMAQNATGTTNAAGNANTQAGAQNDSGHTSASDSNTDKTPDFESLIQRAVDRATQKLGTENKKLRGQIDELKKANLSNEELKQLEIKEKEKEIAERERALQEKENRLVAIKAIKEIGLDDGSDASLALVDFVMADDEETIKARVKAFNELVRRFVKSEVDKTFRSNGRDVGKGSAQAASGTTSDSVAVRLGQNAANANKAAQSTLDYYLGGKK